MSPVDVHAAARRGNVAIVTKYVRGGGDLYVRDRYGNPPLHVASYHGRQACVSALLRAGVDTDALSRTGHTALQFAELKGHSGCVKLLSAPKKAVDKNNKKKQKGKDNIASSGGPELPVPPPPPSAAEVAAAAQESDGSGWHLCYDNDGNAYYYSETTGESIWADPWGDEATSASTTAASQQHYTTSLADTCPPPAGWVVHFDPATGYPYYLHEATNESVWADSDGYFPTTGVPDVSGSASHQQDMHHASGDGAARGYGGGGAAAYGGGWDHGIVGGEADRPPPTAPPSDPAQGQHGGHGGNGMYQGGQYGAMAPNKFFGPSHPEVFPSSSGGSPMACAPPAMESGGTRSSCTPRQQSAPPIVNNDGSVIDHHGGVHQQDSPSRYGAATGSPPGSAVPRSPNGQHSHGYGVSNHAAAVANTKETYRMGFGVVTVEDVLEDRGSHRSFSDSDSTRCYPPSSSDGAHHLDANSPTKAQAPYTPSPSTTVSPVTVSSERAHHSPNYYGYHHQGHGSFPAALPTTANNPYGTGQTPRSEPLPHPPGSPQMPPPPGSYYHPNTADRSSSGGGGGQTVGVNADESLARAAECAMFIGDRKNASVGGGAQGGVRY